MVEQIGKYNVNYAGYSFDGSTEYALLIISEFDANDKEVDRRTLYIAGDAPKLKTEEQIAIFMQYPNYTKLLYEMVPTITVI